MVKQYYKSAVVQISAVFRARLHIDCQKCVLKQEVSDI